VNIQVGVFWFVTRFDTNVSEALPASISNSQMHNEDKGVMQREWVSKLVKKVKSIKHNPSILLCKLQSNQHHKHD
jgi:hypothetical protein